MKIRTSILLAALLCGFNLAVPGVPLGTAFTYQGRLTEGVLHADGHYDFQFRLYTADVGGNQKGGALTSPNVTVAGGQFTTGLDFGPGIFDGTAYWLEIAVLPTGNAPPFITLSPRQLLTPAPNALYAPNAGNAATAATANGLANNTVNSQAIQPNAVTVDKIAPGQVVKSLNSLKDDVILAAGPNITVASVGQTITLASPTWALGGNSGTTPGANYLGTTDNQPIELRAFGQRALRLEPQSRSLGLGTFIAAPNVVAGSGVNEVTAGVIGATISGGGSHSTLSDRPNQVASDFATVGGGVNNRITVNSIYSTIAGGQANGVSPTGGAAGATASTISGGTSNIVANGADYATIGGGLENVLLRGQAVIGGGSRNTNGGSSAVISGGSLNTVGANLNIGAVIAGGGGNFVDAGFSTIGGGNRNSVESGAGYSTIAGGHLNMASADNATIGGGFSNLISSATATDTGATVSGGQNNAVRGSSYATVCGGVGNEIKSLMFGGPNGYCTTIGGGANNSATGDYATIPGGHNNTASGNYSFAAGFGARANHTGSFVWCDAVLPGATCTSAANNDFTVAASGGTRFISGVAAGQGVRLAPGGTAWTTLCDRNAKKNFHSVDGREVLRKLEAVPVQKWNYTWESDGDVPHIGPVAQDFKGAFFPGRDDKTITTLEFDGVALAAIQGLNQEMHDKDAEIRSLKSELDHLKQLVETLAQTRKGMDR